MKQVQPGDVVLHFIDKSHIVGVSIAASKAETTYNGQEFIGLKDTDWADMPGFRIQLRDYIELDPPFRRGEFFGAKKYQQEG